MFFSPDEPASAHVDEPWRSEGLAPIVWLAKHFRDRFWLSAPITPTHDYPLDDPGQYWGIYFLFYRDALVYVGQAVDFAWRLTEHCGAKPFDRYRTLRVPGLLMTDVETYYIHRERPPLNRKYPPLREHMSRLLMLDQRSCS